MHDVAVNGIERVRVVVRVRPPNACEAQLPQSPSTPAVEVDPDHTQLRVCRRKTDASDRDVKFSFDRVFPPETTQDQVFSFLQDSVQQVAQGFNCTVFAYGQTGTGKTHTMLGQELEKSLEFHTNQAQWGVIPRAIASLFEELEAIQCHGAAAIVHCSYMQIYNNEVYDLLQENKQRMKDALVIRELIKGNDRQIYVSGISEFRVTNVDECMRLLQRGNRNRTIRATEYNEKSSRSHALLQLQAEVESRGAESTTIIRRAKLNLVDLAGSEKWDTDVTMGTTRSKELTAINQSLSALGNVISALSNPKRTHIPYRDSRLTRLLQDSLGGNTRTIVIATVSPSEDAVDETISTLQFADRAKRVTVRVQVNEVVDDAVLLAQAQREIARLKLLLKQNASEKVAMLEHKMTLLVRENADLVVENKRLKQRVMALEQQTTKVPEPTTTTGVHKLRLDLIHDNNNNNQQQQPPEQTTGSRRLVEETASLERLEDRQSRLLHEIQSERRELEQQLERMASAREEMLEDDDDICPMCSRLIDHHTDQELDVCIEKEASAMQPKENTSRRSVTPVNIHKPSPYAQDLVLLKKPVASSKPTYIRKTRSLKESPSSSGNQEPPTSQRSGSADVVPTLKGPPKSLKALKLLQTTSPYQTVSRKLEKPEKPDKFSEKSDKSDSGLSFSSRDIGVQLQVYKFRYDCWYPCTIVGFDSKRKLHCVQYEYGDKQWQDLSEKSRIQVLEKSPEA